MWHFILALLLWAPQAQQATQANATSTCIRCHEAMGTDAVALSAQDIHFQNGLSCHNCHGGDPTLGIEKGGPEDSMNPAKGFVGRPERKRIGAFCASCHSRLEYMRQYNPQARVDQYSEYLTSVHGQRNQEGDKNAATCIDCHGAHGIRAVSDPNSPVYATNVASTCGHCHSDAKRMGSYGIPTDQQELYEKSVHGEMLIKERDLSAPTCNDCHGNHGAYPPGVSSVANVCGQCHVRQEELFDQSPHRAAFAAADLPSCVTCHQHHDIVKTSDAMLGTEDTAVCVVCHTSDSAGYKTAAQMKAGIVNLEAQIGSAHVVLERAERAGMEVSRPLFDLTEARNQLVKARVEVHRFDLADLNETLAAGSKIAEASQKSGYEALADLAFRRKGLAVSAVILLCMIGLVLVKIRQLSGKK